MEGETAAQWKDHVSQTVRITTDTSCPHQLLTLSQSRTQWNRVQKRNTDRIISHQTLISIIVLSILSLICIDILPMLSISWIQLAATGLLLMVASVLAHVPRKAASN